MAETVAKLALEDGTVFTGRGFGAEGEAFGEVVFNTSMTGYQEVLTDPSYKGQIVTMTYPLIGNYGVTPEDTESPRPQVEGFIVREASRAPSNFRSQATLDLYLREHNVIGLEGIDTRALVRRLRVRGAMNGVLSTRDPDDAALVHKARNSPHIVGRDLVREVVPERPFSWTKGFSSPLVTYLPAHEPRHHVVALDYGMKWNILRCLVQVGCRVTVLPGTATAAEVLAHEPDGIFLSNGPGDPEPLTYAIDALRRLADAKKPIFGICLGHQLLGLALGGETFKLKFGHRGANQPVLNKRTGRVEITTQNHGFAVRLDRMPTDTEATHVNLNDGTLEGMRHRRLPIFSVQYHPEASAGPHDSGYLFEDFVKLMS
jgi:carbamoyl-phosphate synthase small subunit